MRLIIVSPALAILGLLCGCESTIRDAFADAHYEKYGFHPTFPAATNDPVDEPMMFFDWDYDWWERKSSESP